MPKTDHNLVIAGVETQLALAKKVLVGARSGLKKLRDEVADEAIDWVTSAIAAIESAESKVENL